MYIPVAFIQNPWYDDHFDIPKETQLLGKTLCMLTMDLADTASHSYHLIGCGFYEKFDNGLKLLETLTQQNNGDHSVSQDAVSTVSVVLGINSCPRQSCVT